MLEFLHLSRTYFYQLFEGNQVIPLSDCLSHPYSWSTQPINSDSVARPPCPIDIPNTGYGIDLHILRLYEISVFRLDELSSGLHHCSLVHDIY